MGKIVKISAYEVMQSGGNKTIGAEMQIDDGKTVKTHVATDQKVAEYQTRTIETSRAIYYINNLIGPKLKGVDCSKQLEVDAWLVAADKTQNRESLGVNTIWALSSLLAKAEAASSSTPLYQYLNSIYNKRYSTNPIKIEKTSTPIVPVANKDFKEFCLVPSSSLSLTKVSSTILSLYDVVKKHIRENHLETNFDVFEIILSAIASLDLKLAVDVFIGINFGSQNYYQGGAYDIKDKSQPLKPDAYLDYLTGLVKKYFPLFLIDPLSNDDLTTWKSFNETLSKETYLVGGDLVASSPARFKKILEEKACSSILLKPAQVGTITETLDLFSLAKTNGVDSIICSSDFETGETIVADLAVAIGADFVKFGPPSHEEAICKYNRMLEIEREINKS